MSEIYIGVFRSKYTDRTLPQLEMKYQTPQIRLSKLQLSFGFTSMTYVQLSPRPIEREMALLTFSSFHSSALNSMLFFSDGLQLVEEVLYESMDVVDLIHPFKI